MNIFFVAIIPFLFLSYQALSMQGRSIYFNHKTSTNSFNMTHSLDKSRITALSILKVNEDNNIFYYSVIIPSYLTRGSKIDISNFRKYPSLNDAINEIKKNLSELIFPVMYDYLPTEGCLALIQYDPQKIKILKMNDEEIDKIISNKFIKKSDK